jgi:hypothetical protein
MRGSKCVCSPEVKFGRGHETCPQLKSIAYLSRQEKAQKQQMKVDLGIKPGKKFTNLDFLLNIVKSLCDLVKSLKANRS